jgi:hypothetical protein
LYQPWMLDCYDGGAISGVNEWYGNPKYWEKFCYGAVLSRTDCTWFYSGWNTGRRSVNPATNRLSCGTARVLVYTGVNSRNNLSHWAVLERWTDGWMIWIQVQPKGNLDDEYYYCLFYLNGKFPFWILFSRNVPIL